MRTTITLDDHLAKALKSLAHRTGKPFKAVVNETLRAGLASRDAPVRPRPYVLRPTSLGGPMPGIDLSRARDLAAALEDEEIVRKLRQRK